MCIDLKCGSKRAFFSSAWVCDAITFFFRHSSIVFQTFLVTQSRCKCKEQLNTPNWPPAFSAVYFYSLHLWYNLKESLRYARITVQKWMFSKMKEMLLRKKNCQRVNAADIFQQRPKSTRLCTQAKARGEGEEKRVSQGYIQNVRCHSVYYIANVEGGTSKYDSEHQSQ